jgi:uncharacterized protein YbcC (UPF0753/DUF2309 family)
VQEQHRRNAAGARSRELVGQAGFEPVILAKAGALARAERAGLLALDAGSSTDAQIVARSRDWSQVRPEWGLAGNAAFIAAPRERTQGLDLGGRAFLHNYDWTQDSGFGVLELIMTAPMVVASWINLQYYGSTVNNRSFGSGNKVLHNVVGALGVLEGNAGDLKTGLPFQSVHDGQRFVHEPLRLNVFIEAPEAEMNRIIANETTPDVLRIVSKGGNSQGDLSGDALISATSVPIAVGSLMSCSIEFSISGGFIGTW